VKEGTVMKLLVQAAATALGTATLVLTGVGAAHATDPSPATGQPNQSCEDSTTRPGNASTAPGSAFNPDGHAGTVYAGEQAQNQKNPKSVSQYDVACFQVSR